MTARIYLRVSTGLQAEKGFSLDAQREKALAWCRCRTDDHQERSFA